MAEMVVDPGVPPEDASLLHDNPHLLSRMRRGWVPDPPPRRAGRLARVSVVIVGLLTILLMLMISGIVGTSTGALLLGVIGVPLIIMSLVGADIPEGDGVRTDRETYQRARCYEGQYVLPEELDEASQRLLARAQSAIRAVTYSSVNAEGLLDGVRNAVMLPAQEWEIARLLAKLSALRAKHRQTVSEGLTPEVAAVAEPLARALDSSEDAVVARVEALERYATNVAEAERAYRAHHQIEELRGRLGEYEELVAESGADSFAVPEITRLAQEADQLEQALRRSITSAHEAFRHLPGES
ncbi:hypothetical protein ACIBHX_15420 [Nonomuraea sp. NPDC050536]|uniref:hypothetical protein n=1 Tax=Nonomuraea sp. NPDC050536 TaxID=3364366 RepID=UPI0037C6A40E